MAAPPTIVNYIEIADETFLMDDLPEERKLRISELMQDRIMEPLGYKRVESA